MAVELDGNLRMKGDSGPGIRVQVLADQRRLRLVSGNELIGDWDVASIGVKALDSGFIIKAEGEEFVLRTDDDVAVVDELELAAASPRLARQLAARHNPDEPAPVQEPKPIRSNVGAIGLALAGGLIILGGTFLNVDGAGSTAGVAAVPSTTRGDGFWLAFVVGGVLLIGAAYVLSIGVRLARIVATILVLSLVALFGFFVTGSDPDGTRLIAYGFIAGGLVVGVSVLVGGSIRSDE